MELSLGPYSGSRVVLSQLIIEKKLGVECIFNLKILHASED